MPCSVRDVDTRDLRRFGELIVKLERSSPFDNVRQIVLEDLLDLLNADVGASYVWNAGTKKFDKVVSRNISSDNILKYDDWLQYNDPMTLKMRAARRPVLFQEVISRADLERTEFYNEFIRPERMEHGINLFLFDRDDDLGDFRIWRQKGRPEFTDREVSLVSALQPFLQDALLRAKQFWHGMTPREGEVGALVARGCTDHDIARILGISFGTVRTHVNRLLEKRSCANRAELAAVLSRSFS